MKNIPIRKANALKTLHPDSLVRVYTRQTLEAWNILSKEGALYCTAEYALDGVWGKDEIPDSRERWIRPYDWMRERMAEEIEGFSGAYPIWAWVKRPTTKAKHVINSFPRGEQVLITADVPRRRILFSDFDRWHDPLNFFPCTRNEAEFDSWDDSDLHSEEKRALREETWRRIFHFGCLPDEDPQWVSTRDTVIVQACIDGLFLHEVKKARYERIEKSHASWGPGRQGTTRLDHRILLHRR